MPRPYGIKAQSGFSTEMSKEASVINSQVKKKQAQDLLNQGYSAYRVAKETGLSESAIRYHLRSGVLKKSSKSPSDHHAQRT